jgi:hypothetical protein
MLQDAFEELVGTFEAERRAEDERLAAAALLEELRSDAVRRTSRRYDSLTRRSTVRLAQQAAWATVALVGEQESRYHSLVADSSADLTAWVDRNNGTPTSRKVPRLRMHPLILEDSGRMGFARVGKERISYVRTTVSWRAPLSIDSYPLQVTVKFPDSDTNERNIALTFAVPDWLGSRSFSIDAHFDAETFTILESTSRATVSDLERATREYLRGPRALRMFIQKYFAAFKYTELGVGAHNAREFFPGTRYKIRLFECASTPFFLATKVW